MRPDPTIRAEQPADAAAIHAIQSTAFGRAAEADLVAALRRAGVAEISLVALDGAPPVGHVLFSRLEAPMPALALAPVAVCPHLQRAGIGSQLIRAGLAAAVANGWQAVFVVGDPAFYSRFGFSVAAARGYDCVYAGDYFMAKILNATAPRAGTIAYPAPFRALED